MSLRLALGLVTAGALAGCPSDPPTVQALPDGAGIFVEKADLRSDLLVLPAAVHDDVVADPDAARFLARIDGELGAAALPDLPLPEPAGDPFIVYDSIPDGSGGWYVIGRTWINGTGDTMLLAYDANGGERWRHVFTDAFDPQRLMLDDGGVLVRGFDLAADNGGGIRALTANGVVRFEHGGLPWIAHVGLLADGGMILIGRFELPFDPGGGLPPLETPGGAIFIVGLDAAGATSWARSIEPTRPVDSLTMSAATSARDGRVYVAGRGRGPAIAVGSETLPITRVTPEGSMTFVLALAPGGALDWSVVEPTLQPDLVALAPLDDGVVAAATVVIGHDMDPASFAGVNYGPTLGGDAVVMEIGAGQVRWQRTIGGAEFQEEPDIATTRSGAVFASIRSERGAPENPEATVVFDRTTLRGDGTLLVELDR
jgi:hypothetical protein